LLGWSPPDSTQEIFNLAEAAKVFSFERVNKAGAKFDWAKLDWLNSQYLHNMPVAQLTDLLIPFWQAAGYEFDPTSDRTWLEQLASLVGASLTRLTDAVEMSRLFFTQSLEYSEDAGNQLQQQESTAVLQGILTALDTEQLTEVSIQDMIKRVMKEQNVKKGVIMRSLRAALMGDMHGPDLIQSWLILHQLGQDKPRLQQAIAHNSHSSLK